VLVFDLDVISFFFSLFSFQKIITFLLITVNTLVKKTCLLIQTHNRFDRILIFLQPPVIDHPDLVPLHLRLNLHILHPGFLILLGLLFVLSFSLLEVGLVFDSKVLVDIALFCLPSGVESILDVAVHMALCFQFLSEFPFHLSFPLLPLFFWCFLDPWVYTGDLLSFFNRSFPLFNFL
jgi:hypothetical protein